VDREVGRGLAVAIAYIRKDGRGYIGWTDVGSQYREETRALPDGRSVLGVRARQRHGRSPLWSGISLKRLRDEVLRYRSLPLARFAFQACSFSARTSVPINASEPQRLGGHYGRGQLKSANSARNATVQ
jgi:hypothetical protein